jgi:phage major head subunit gpT-like protein
MLITGPELKRLFQKFNFNYLTAFGQRQTYWQKIAMHIPSTTTEEVHTWLAQLPQLRKLIGPAVAEQIAAHNYTLGNEPYGLDAEIPVDRLSDDQYGTFAKVPSLFGDSAAQWPDDRVFALLEAGTTTDCWDGEAFFSGSHPNNYDKASAGTYRNYYDATVGGGGTAYPLTQENVQAGMAFIAALVGESGRPLGLRPKFLGVPPLLELTADEITKGPNITRIVQDVAGADNVAAAAPSNMLQGKLQTLCLDRLTDTEAWYLICEFGGMLPLIYQDRESPKYQMNQDPMSTRIYKDRQVDHFVRARGGFGFSMPQLCFKFSPAS